MKQDVIEFTILDDGTIKWSTSKVSQMNHTSADQLLAEAMKLMPGETKVEQKGHEGHEHTHVHKHA